MNFWVDPSPFLHHSKNYQENQEALRSEFVSYHEFLGRFFSFSHHPKKYQEAHEALRSKFVLLAMKTYLHGPLSMTMLLLFCV